MATDAIREYASVIVCASLVEEVSYGDLLFYYSEVFMRAGLWAKPIVAGHSDWRQAYHK